MRLLVLTQDFPPALGGISSYASELARRWSRRFDVTVVAPRAPHGLDGRTELRVRRARGEADLLGLMSASDALSGRYDVAFAAQWGAAPAALLARRLGRLGSVAIAAHGRELLLAPWPNPAQTLYDRARRGALRAADLLLPVSTYTAGLLVQMGADPERVHVVSNGTDPERFWPSPSPLGLEGRPIVLTVSRLVRRKGIDTVLDAWPAIRARCPEAVYYVVGTGPEEARLVERARRFAGSVRFVGKVSDEALPAWYNAADLFVMPARAEGPDVEGFGLVFLEAGACGKPVIGARSGGVPDAIGDGETGLLVPPGDREALAAAMLRVLEDPGYAAALGQAGRARAEASSWDHVADRIADLLMSAR